MLYLDNAATTVRKPLPVYAELMRSTLFMSGNAGRGSHKKSMRAVRAIVDAQDAAAELFNIDEPQNIVFTQNATQALNTAILGSVTDGGHIVVTQMEHNSVLRPVYLLGNYTIVKADKDGLVNAKDVENAIRPDTRLIVCTHASNVCGTIEPVCEIGVIAKNYGIPFLVDAAQTAGSEDIDVKKMNADFLAFPGHKGLMGPLGTGGLYVRKPEKLRPLMTGGTGSNSESLIQPEIMPDKFHSGTVNTPAIAALEKGIRYILKRGTEAISSHEKTLARAFRNNLRNMRGVTVYGSENAVSTVAFNIDGVGSEEGYEYFASRAALRAGLHCAPLAHRALGTEKTGAIRASFGIYNSMRDVKKVTDIIMKSVKEIQG